jgi:23S rRNA (adenine-C8)-methyltransferase
MNYSKYEEMKRLIVDMKLPYYRYEQIIKAIFSQHISTFERMSTLPLKLKTTLIDTFGPSVCCTVPVACHTSGQADKILLSLPDGNRVEAVNLHYKKGWESFCISSQCGCGFGCQFCATGTIGHKRNMNADEITDQLLYFYLNGHKLNSISFMGMGEPLANPNLFDALNILNDSSLFALSQRRITISTIGIIPGIRRLTDEFPQINLAFSLHSPFEKQRSELMPVNRSFPLHEVMEALDSHIRRTGRRLFLAYIMLNGVNDSVDHAKELVQLLQNRGSWTHLYHVDLIPYNSTDKTPRRFSASDKGTIKRFSDILRAEGISVAIRTQFGSDINAACGQLYGNDQTQIVTVKDFQKRNEI